MIPPTPPTITSGPPASGQRAARGFHLRHALHLPLVLAACAAIYWPMLGASGLSSTEGHRVIPGWAMLESGDWLRVTMFELGYLRKPPGMPWAVAGSSALLGQTEFAARAVSAGAATLMAVLAFAFATRWFGRPWGLAAGLGCAMMPQLWSAGRSAEIESLNNLATLGAACLLVELVAPPARRRLVVGQLGIAAAAAAAIVLTALAKGPASAPVLAAIPLGACLAMRSARPLMRPALWVALVLAAGMLVVLGRWILGANDADETVHQGVSDFLWTPDRALAILGLAAAAFASAMPASLALLFPLGPHARAEAEGERGALIARTLAWAWVLALIGYTAAGVSNPRYAMPAAVLLPLVVAYAARGWMGAAPAFNPQRRRIARVLSLGHPAVLPIALAVGAAVFVPLSEGYRGRSSGREAGHAIGAAIVQGLGGSAASGPVLLWADEMVETRPEVLLYAARAAAGEGAAIRPVWAKPAMMRGELPPAGAYMLLKTDARGAPEVGRYAAAVGSGRLVRVVEGTVHKFAFTLYRVTPAP